MGPLGAARVRARRPGTDREAIRAALAQVAELAALLITDDSIRAEPVPDIDYCIAGHLVHDLVRRDLRPTWRETTPEGGDQRTDRRLPSGGAVPATQGAQAGQGLLRIGVPAP